jgi:cobalt/nickel transport system permease protein
MDIGLDGYVDLDSPIHRWDARYKLAGIFFLIFSFSFVRSLYLLPSIILITLVILVFSRIPFSYVINRLKYPGIFLLVIAVVLPLFTGTNVIAQLGPLAIRLEGTLELILIVVKFVCILTLALVLFSSAPVLVNIKAMRAMHLPPLLADIALLTYRYIFEIGNDLKKMETAMRLRNFKAGRLSFTGLGVLSSLAGTLLVRSYERSERIYKAMILRGYGSNAHNGVANHLDFQANLWDKIALAGFLLLSGLIVASEIFLSK